MLKVKPGIKPLFFNQKMAAKLPLKNIPSTAANATTRSGNVALSWLIQFNAQFAFLATQGRVSIALNKKSLLEQSQTLADVRKWNGNYTVAEI